MSELADRVRTKRQQWAVPGSSHDRVIRTTRVAFPVAIGVLVVLLGAAPLTMGREALYRGEDAKGQPFQIRAGSAVQVSSRDPVVKLKDLSARIALADGPATIGARTGRYDMNSERVAVDGPVVFQAADGYRIETRDVAIDLKTRRIASGGPVDGRMPLGTFSANHLKADLNRRTVVLDGGARLHIVQGQSRGSR
jgi:lipopolysaccharide export system protein LptC